MTKKQFYVGVALFLLLETARKDINGKRLRKKIARSFKKAILEEKSKWMQKKPKTANTLYIGIINEIQEIMELARSTMRLENTKLMDSVGINPGLLLKKYFSEYPELYDTYSISEKDLKEYYGLFEDTNIVLITIMYFNRLNKYINERTDDMTKHDYEEHIRLYEERQENLMERINSKKLEIDDMEEDDATYEERELKDLQDEYDANEKQIKNLESKIEALEAKDTVVEE